MEVRSTSTFYNRFIMDNHFQKISVYIKVHLKVDVGDHCRAAWCIIIF